jgi:hypothetical protein
VLFAEFVSCFVSGVSVDIEAVLGIFVLSLDINEKASVVYLDGTGYVISDLRL